ncbi:hypothetical protein PYCC9005_002731 [Savitreella phatthalungensis]
MAADLYMILGLSSDAGAADIRRAYKKRSLETHPDRFAANTPEQRRATAAFQEVNNAYYVLSDPGRRRTYDADRSSQTASGGFSGWFGAGDNSHSSTTAEARASEQFANVFEEMMNDEAAQSDANSSSAARDGTGNLYSIAGGAAGAVLGFIVANVPGLFIGAAAGNRLGAVRDRKGKSVYEVFQEMPQAEKARILSELLRKVMQQVS